MRVVLDVNVLVSAVLAPRGTPAAVLARWREGEFELIVSESLLDELRRALDYPKIRKHVTRDEATELLELLRRSARREPDPTTAPRRAADASDDYLIALAESAKAMLVTGDASLLTLRDRFPVLSPRESQSRLP